MAISDPAKKRKENLDEKWLQLLTKLNSVILYDFYVLILAVRACFPLPLVVETIKILSEVLSSLHSYFVLLFMYAFQHYIAIE